MSRYIVSPSASRDDDGIEILRVADDRQNLVSLFADWDDG